MAHAVSDSTLQRFAAGRATPEEKREVVLHLLRGCVSCAERLREIERPAVPAGAYAASLDKFAADLRRKLKPAAKQTVARLLV